VSWRRAARRDLPAVLDFLLGDEALCVPFTSRLRSGTRGCEVYFRADARGAATDSILFSSSGLLLPVLSRRGGGCDGLGDLLHSLTPAVHSIMGVGRCVNEAESLLPLPPTTRVEYFLMTLHRDDVRAAFPLSDPRLHIRRAGPSDAESLFELQKGYELEEVVIDPIHFSEAQCMRLLKASLKDELVYVAERDGVPVAKAATNARGFGVDQVGGVYTAPGERGKGIGAMVVGELLKAIFRDKQGACLFVKKRNRPAIALYDRLGFAPVTDYVISYYGI
jgi:ribosomal protein S18 acetylase RimI-like enzyme